MELIGMTDFVIGSLVHIDNVIDLIQEELKKKIAYSEELIIDKFPLLNGQKNVLKIRPSSILNTEIL